MLDHDLAKFYEIETKFINRAAVRNPERFPFNFRFQLTEEETQAFSSVTTHGGRRKRSYVFTQEGVAMRSVVLRSRRAAEVSVLLMTAFMQQRPLSASASTSSTNWDDRINQLEQRLLSANRCLLDSKTTELRF